MTAAVVAREAPPSGAHSSARRLIGIDVLRAIAALAVVVTHLPFGWGAATASHGASALPTAVTSITHYGQYGVHLFLVLSGFCIHMGWARRQLTGGAELDFVGFWRRRLRRLYPPYFVALIGALLGMVVLARLAHIPVTGAASVFGYASDFQLAVDVLLLVVLAQNLNGASERVGNGPFWSLALEEQLYLLYFPLLALRRRWGWGVALGVAAVVSLGWRAVYAADPTPPGFWYLVGPARWIEWALGALAVEAHLGLVRLPRWLASPWTALGALAGALLLTPPARAWVVPGAWIGNDLAFASAAFVLVNMVCARERDQGMRSGVARALGGLGVMSYSIYLVHNPAMIVAKRLAVAAGVTSVPLVLLIRVLAAALASVVFFWLVERRFLNAPARDAVTSPSSEEEGVPVASAPARTGSR